MDLLCCTMMTENTVRTARFRVRRVEQQKEREKDHMIQALILEQSKWRPRTMSTQMRDCIMAIMACRRMSVDVEPFDLASQSRMMSQR